MRAHLQLLPPPGGRILDTLVVQLDGIMITSACDNGWAPASCIKCLAEALMGLISPLHRVVCLNIASWFLFRSYPSGCAIHYIGSKLVQIHADSRHPGVANGPAAGAAWRETWKHTSDGLCSWLSTSHNTWLHFGNPEWLPPCRRHLHSAVSLPPD
ncbi:MAG: hypothetical protein WDW36_002727 [Sanguina aurantia]